MDVPAAYLALRDKVDAFAAGVHARCGAALACRRGCSACCHAELTVSPVEAAALREALAALPPTARAALSARAAAPPDGACVFLMADACAVYAARPLVCRTQGLPLHYPGGVIPGAALLRGLRDVTCCPLNFQSQRPSPADILDADRVDQMLALVNLAHARDRGLDPLARQPLRALAL